jgi:hypothetical protein
MNVLKSFILFGSFVGNPGRLWKIEIQEDQIRLKSSLGQHKQGLIAVTCDVYSNRNLLFLKNLAN